MAPPPPHRTAPHRTALRTQGTSSIVNGLHAGFLESDLAFEANVWNGIPNGGEYYITGSFFCHGYIPDVLDVNPNEELVTDPSAEGRFLLCVCHIYCGLSELVGWLVGWLVVL